jgi:hypothetical protein
MQRVIKRERVQLGTPARKASAKSPSCAPHGHGRGVRLVKIDGRIAAIELTCSCGEVSMLELCYDEPKA